MQGRIKEMVMDHNKKMNRGRLAGKIVKNVVGFAVILFLMTLLSLKAVL